MSASDTRRGTFEVHRDDQSVNLPTALSPERVAEINEVIGRITRWARGREDIVGLLLVGSCARNAARPDSDIDIVLLTTDESRYLLGDAWAGEPGLGELIRTQSWGPITERRGSTASGLEVELCIGSPTWAKTDPVDRGTHRVVTDGARVLHDPAGILADLLAAC
ncbi:nucleotidyltransferase domain-containing protein [Streptomyces prasinus]|uniref:nucleotidyltransferase domain-containing protein n=1 Tax=Streptomyces prasinus TaxID=67345 RepID=UPI00368FEB0C